MITDATLRLPQPDRSETLDRSCRRAAGVFRPSTVRQITIVAKKEFGDRFRSGWVIACVLLWLGAIACTSFLGLLQIGRVGVQGYERTVISLLNLVQYLVPLLGLLLGHDLVVHESEERTLRLLLAGGLSRARFFIGKFLGGCLTLTVPLALGFAVAGTVVGLAARDSAVAPFVRLAVSGLVLGILFLGIGAGISTFSRSRVQSLVVALLAWCLAVFAFDLAALGLMVSLKAPAAAQEIEVICDATHVNAMADIHSDFEKTTDARPHSVGDTHVSAAWLSVNPIDLFRAINLTEQVGFSVPGYIVASVSTFWLLCPLGLGCWKLKRTDL